MAASADRRYSPRTRNVGVSVAAVVALAAAGTFAVNTTSASAELAPLSAQELLVAMHEADPSPLSGTVAIEADLGLPDVGGLGNGNADPTALLAGTNTARIWMGGHAQSRVDLLGDAEETRINLNGTDLWTWSSSSKEARHYILPTHDEMSAQHGTDTGDTADRDAMMKKHRGATAPHAPATPQEAADQVLEAVGETTAVTTENTRVAGRDAYSLVLSPKTQGTLVDRIELAVDGSTKLPLRVQVFSTKMSNPAYSVGFTKVAFEAPDASVFEFTPPSGATVTTTDVVAKMNEQPGRVSAADKAEARGTMKQRYDAAKTGDESEKLNVVGEGWARVYLADAPKDKNGESVGNVADALLAELNGESEMADSDAASTLAQLVSSLPKRTAGGVSGTVFEGTLFTIVLADDGRAALGAVPAGTVFAALAAK